MRNRLVLIAIASLAAGSAVIGETASASSLPKLIVGSYSGIEPSVIGFSGDGGNIVGKLKWTWGQTSAVGHGISDIQGCVPNCAEGTETPVKTTITLSMVREGHFTKIVEQRGTERLVGHYESDTWPAGAQQR